MDFFDLLACDIEDPTGPGEKARNLRSAASSVRPQARRAADSGECREASNDLERGELENVISSFLTSSQANFALVSMSASYAFSLAGVDEIHQASRHVTTMVPSRITLLMTGMGIYT
jgi:hypothetical protein